MKEHRLTAEEAVKGYEVLNSLEIDYGLKMEKTRSELLEKVVELIES